jgi:Xaa-Pro aminopeptidase
MKKDLDALMKQEGLDGLLILGDGNHNPAMVYLTGGGHFTDAILLVKAGIEPLLCVNPLEREAVPESGFQVFTFADLHFFDLMKEQNGDLLRTEAYMMKQLFEKADLLKGRVAVAGIVEIGKELSVINSFQKLMPEIEFVHESERSVLNLARVTKDRAELDRIVRMGNVTTRVVSKTAEFLQTRRVKGDTLYQDGKPLTIGDVKNRINLWLAEEGVENPEDTIFSIGRDAAIGHSAGTPTDVITLGKTIVFDIYPCEKGGGYFYDFTRTWCLGYAPEEVQTLYNQVRQVYETVVPAIKVGTICKEFQVMTCNMFEKMGHPTMQTNKSTEDGYNHSLGHGLGLNVHEAPWFSTFVSADDILAPGMVFTVEPGLYYPDKGMGVRLEDTYYVDVDGSIVRCAEYPLDLILPMKG